VVRHEGTVAGPLDADRQPRSMRRWVEAELVESLAMLEEDGLAIAVARRVQRDSLRDLAHERRN